MDVLRDLTHPRSFDAAYSPPFALATAPLPDHDPAAMLPPPSPLLSCGVAPSLVHHRPPLALQSPNTPFRAPAVPSSSAKPATARRKPAASKASASSKASSRAPPSLGGDTADEETNPDGTPLYLAPDYTLNPAGPASSADVDFKCPQCDKVYRGKHARSIWRRHLQDKHGIPLSQQPRRTRWDTDASRPKSEEEKRARTLDSKRRWARKNRADKGGKPPTDAAAAPSLSGSVGTPASEQSSEQAGPNGGEDEGDSSFDAGSVSGWSDGARGGSAPVHAPAPVGAYGVAPSNPFYGAGGASVYGRTPTKPAYGPPALLAGGGAMDPYLAGMARAPLRATASMPPVYAPDDPRAPLHLRDANSYASGGEDGPPVHPHATQYTYGPTNPYSHPFLPPHHQVAQERPHAFPPLGYDEYGQPLNPALFSAASALPRRPSSNPTFGASTNPYDHPGGASPVVVTAGQPAPVALPYYARRHGSPARHLAAGHSGIAAGVPIPSSSTRESSRTAAVAAAGGLESPVKLRRTGKGKEAGGGGPGGVRDDAAGILLALKAGPSSPMAGLAHVQSPVSSVRDQGERRGLVLLGRGARAGAGTGTGGRTVPSDGEPDEDESDDDDEAEVRGMMLRSRAASGGALSPWRAALKNQQSPVTAAAVVAPVVSPRKRGRSESPAPNLASTSSGEGSTAAAHALLATAKKAHQYATVVHGHPLRGNGPAWDHGMSLVATPTPGNLMRIAMESSPVVRFGGGGGARQGEPDSEADLIGGGADDDDGDGEVDAFTSSSGGVRRPRHGRSVSPSSQKGRRRVPGAGGSSSSGAGGASSSSQPRVLHHHHPVGLTSELGDFDLQHSSSSSSVPRQQYHHHHDPLREDETAMGAAHPGSSSSASSHLVTPAPTTSRTTTSVAAAAAAAALAHAQAHADNAQAAPRTHPHDPFLAAPGTSAALPLTLVGGGDRDRGAERGEPVARTSSPPGGFSSFLFSSPAHPQFSKTLGLTAAPGPGVLYTGAAGGETPARGGGGAHQMAAGMGIGGRSREASQDELLALAIGNSRERERMDAVKTPVMARVALEGARRAAAAAGGGMHPSDVESATEEDEEGGSATTGTARDESQSPDKATLDGEEDDDDEDGGSLDS
ncbi:hypothetical protein JCM3770_000606 [Rhodotorula araucariae]